MFGETYTIITTSIILFALMYRLLLYPINKRCNIAFNSILGEEIARKLYHQIDPDFTYKKEYNPDDRESQVIVETALKEFERLLNERKTKNDALL